MSYRNDSLAAVRELERQRLGECPEADGWPEHRAVCAECGKAAQYKVGALAYCADCLAEETADNLKYAVVRMKMLYPKDQTLHFSMDVLEYLVDNLDVKKEVGEYLT